MWLVLCIVWVTTAVCDALLGLVPHIRVRSMGIGDNGCKFSVCFKFVKIR